MTSPRMRTVMIAILHAMLSTSPILAMAEAQKDDNPIPKALAKIKEIGKEAGKEFSQATRKTAGAIKRAVKGEKSTDETERK